MTGTNEHHVVTFGKTDGRKFGLTVGTAFLVLSAVFMWRSREIPVYATAAVGVGLVMGGLVAPLALRPVYRAWMKLALVLSRVTTPIFMSLIYFLVVTPTGIMRRTVGKNPLRHESTGGSYWKTRDPAGHHDLRRQF